MAMGMQRTIKMNVATTGRLWPEQVVDEIQKVMEAGEAAGKSGWETRTDHVNHAYNHLVAYFDKDTSEDHLTHAFTRLMMAVAITKGYTNGGGEDA
jgi:hypothetical protein